MTASAETRRIERELEQTRQRLDVELTEVQERLAPGRLAEEALAYARQAGVAGFSRNLGRSVRDNPLPVTLVGAGLAWLIAADRRGPPAPSNSETSDLAARARDAAAALQRQAGETQEAFEERAYEAKARVLGVTRAAQDTVEVFRSRVDEGLTEASRRYGQMRDKAAETLSDGAHGASGTVSELVGRLQDQPILMGALGLSLGAVIAALLPPTQLENNLMGEAGDSLREQAASGMSDAVSAAGRVAEQTADAAREAARDEIRDDPGDGITNEPGPRSAPPH